MLIFSHFKTTAQVYYEIRGGLIYKLDTRTQTGYVINPEDYPFPVNKEPYTGETYEIANIIAAGGKMNLITGIAANAFADNPNLKSITGGESLQTIGRRAFANCTKLETFHIGGNISGINTEAFTGCSKLEKFTVDQSNQNFKAIDGVLFSKDGITLVKYPPNKKAGEYSIPQNVSTLKDYSFADCISLRALTIEGNITGVADNIFNNNQSIRSMTFGPNVTKVAKLSKMDDALPNLTSVTIGCNVTDISWIFPRPVRKLICFPAKKPNGFVVEDNTTMVYTPNSSYNCRGIIHIYEHLKNIFTVDGLKYVVTSTADRECVLIDTDYVGCSNPGSSSSVLICNNEVVYENVKFKVTHANPWALAQATQASNLNIYIEVPDNFARGSKFGSIKCYGKGRIGNYAFYGVSRLSTDKPSPVNQTSVTLSEDVTNIEDYAFSNMKSRLIVELNNNGYIGYKAFENSQVYDLCIGDNVSFVGDFSFYNAYLSHDVDLRNVTRIGKNAFYKCQFKTLTLGKNLKSIEMNAFDGCNLLTALKCNAVTPPELQKETLAGIDKFNCRLYVPKGAAGAYSEADQWKEFLHIIEDPELAVENIEIDNLSDFDINSPDIEIYNLQGIRIYKPESGIYIIRKGRNVKKVSVP